MTTQFKDNLNSQLCHIDLKTNSLNYTLLPHKVPLQYMPRNKDQTDHKKEDWLYLLIYLDVKKYKKGIK